tara:strand:- start:1343 stop:1519 length:177 start_codon:yes stop_codon:yes gene_type:complete
MALTKQQRELNEFKDIMYKRYCEEKKGWNESDILSKKEYLSQNKILIVTEFHKWLNNK